MNYFGIIDCNNFYVSCERAFNPTLNNYPVVVLSNNDGCVVSRSNEAKAMGIPMGAPYWEYRNLLIKNKAKVFSSNYRLYGDMSSRIMQIIHQHCDEVEDYSIDEAFMKIKNFNEKDLIEYGIEIRKIILQCTGIPVSIGFAKTKTLAKLANHYAKKQTRTGVYYMTSTDSFLNKIPINEVWGIGRGYQRRLSKASTVAELIQLDEQYVYQQCGILGLRMLKELKGQPCYDLNSETLGRKSMVVSRTFKKDISDLNILSEAFTAFIIRLGEKLRKHKQVASSVTIFLRKNRYKNFTGRLTKVSMYTLDMPTSYTGKLLQETQKCLKTIHKKGDLYKKGGVMANDLRPENVHQLHLFESDTNQGRKAKLMQTVDRLNWKMGKNTVSFGGHTKDKNYLYRKERKTPEYTTRWKDILVVK